MDIDKTHLTELLVRGIFMAEGFDLVFGWMRKAEGGMMRFLLVLLVV